MTEQIAEIQHDCDEVKREIEKEDIKQDGLLKELAHAQSILNQSRIEESNI